MIKRKPTAMDEESIGLEGITHGESFDIDMDGGRYIFRHVCYALV